MNEQEIFDTVVRHLAKQGRKAAVMRGSDDGTSTFESCVYRGPDGLKCAVGCLLEDSEYDEAMEGRGIDGLIESGRAPERLKPFALLLTRLQTAHDFPMSGEGVRHRLVGIAAEHELSGDVLSEVSFPEQWRAVGR